MDSSKYSGSYFKGLAGLIILSLLKKEDMYGYQLVQEMSKQSGGLLSMQEGSLYPVLYRLLDAGYISDRKEPAGKRLTRIYYHIEPTGLEHLDGLIREYRSITEGVLMIIGGGSHERNK